MRARLQTAGPIISHFRPWTMASAIHSAIHGQKGSCHHVENFSTAARDLPEVKWTLVRVSKHLLHCLVPATFHSRSPPSLHQVVKVFAMHQNAIVHKSIIMMKRKQSREGTSR